jgi:hypothetical protein
MSRVFSGGCVYEFWQGANRYGLVEMRDQKTETRPATYRQAPDDQNKVNETRESDQGLLLIYHDFANYKANLAATKGVEAEWNRISADSEAIERGDGSLRQTSWPWEPEFHEPESCVDWGETEERVKSGA